MTKPDPHGKIRLIVVWEMFSNVQLYAAAAAMLYAVKCFYLPVELVAEML